MRKTIVLVSVVLAFVFMGIVAKQEPKDNSEKVKLRQQQKEKKEQEVLEMRKAIEAKRTKNLEERERNRTTREKPEIKTKN
jgi:hypothetical protein